jgi:hypothetical protein
MSALDHFYPEEVGVWSTAVIGMGRHKGKFDVSGIDAPEIRIGFFGLFKVDKNYN